MFKQRTGMICSCALITEKCVFKGKRPVKAYVLGVAARQFAGTEDGAVVVNEPVAECGPGEEVDRYGMLGACLRKAA